MKIAFLVLLMTAAVFALWDDRGGRRIKHTPAHHPGMKDDVDCEVGEDCEDLCDWQCYNSVGTLCIDGSCYCEMDGLQKKKH